MRKTTPVFGRNRKPGYPCAIPLKSHTDLQRKYANSNRQPLFLASFCNKFPVTGDKALRRLVSQDCVHHQEVRANRLGFPGDKNPRSSGRFASRGLVCEPNSGRSPVVCAIPFDHAAQGETSLLMALLREGVDKSRIAEDEWYSRSAREASVELEMKGRDRMT